MPTRNRPTWAARAVELFESQTWTDREIVILDDRDSPSFPTPPTGPRIVYHGLTRRMNIGAKRNLCVSRSSGEVIAHWDDDDYYATERIEKQVGLMEETGAEVVGFHSAPFRNCSEAWMYEHIPPYAIGSSLMYRREFWKRNPFPDYKVAEDVHFVRAAMREGVLASVPANGLMEASVHPGNTSPRVFVGKTWRKLCA